MEEARLESDGDEPTIQTLLEAERPSGRSEHSVAAERVDEQHQSQPNVRFVLQDEANIRLRLMLLVNALGCASQHSPTLFASQRAQVKAKALKLCSRALALIHMKCDLTRDRARTRANTCVKNCAKTCACSAIKAITQ
jgi:hypothetical protein